VGGYALHGPAAVAVLAAVVVVTLAVAVVLRSVLLGGSDQRSPFVRFMLLTCLLTGRPPGDYLPPGPGERRCGPAASRRPAGADAAIGESARST
jgi:hypothetical protein